WGYKISARSGCCCKRMAGSLPAFCNCFQKIWGSNKMTGLPLGKNPLPLLSTWATAFMAATGQDRVVDACWYLDSDIMVVLVLGLDQMNRWPIFQSVVFYFFRLNRAKIHCTTWGQSSQINRQMAATTNQTMSCPVL